MKHQDLVNFPEKAIVVMDASLGPSYEPNMMNGSIFRITETVNVTMVNPKNSKDGHYIRLEIATGTSNTITFGTKYTIDGLAIDPVTNSNGLYILEGRYSQVRDELLLRVV